MTTTMVVAASSNPHPSEDHAGGRSHIDDRLCFSHRMTIATMMMLENFCQKPILRA